MPYYDLSGNAVSTVYNASSPVPNKVVYGNTTVIDLTDTTATAADVVQGTYFYAANGVKTAGAKVADDANVTMSGISAADSGSDGNVVLSDSGSATLGTKSITANGTYNASSDSLDGYSSVTVNVPAGSPSLQTKTATYTPTTSTQSDTISADSGYDGLSSVGVTVDPIPSGYIVPSGSQTLTANGTYDVTSLAEVVVNVASSGGAEVITGTFSPETSVRTWTLTDCIGKTNILIYPVSSIVAPSSGRTHWGELFISGTSKLSGSSNSSNSSWSVHVGTNSTWTSSTGVVTITTGASSNYGGYYTAGMTYGYAAW